GGIFPSLNYTRGDSTVSTGFRGINALCFSRCKKYRFKEFQIILLPRHFTHYFGLDLLLQQNA
ncbi:MAG: hypothetical protein WBI74_03610, partial [Caldicoprobacterales bacterium]